MWVLRVLGVLGILWVVNRGRVSDARSGFGISAVAAAGLWVVLGVLRILGLLGVLGIVNR